MLHRVVAYGLAALVLTAIQAAAQMRDPARDQLEGRRDQWDQRRDQWDQRREQVPDDRRRDTVFLPNDGGLYHRARDAVRWAGHRCDTVHMVEITGGAYLVTCSSGPYWLVDRGTGLRVIPGRPGGSIEQPALTIR